ncbi:MAG TPA: aminopeptidase, partial [Myxococcota bacterium]
CASGCLGDTSYLLEQGIGQAQVLAAAQPVAPLLADKKTPYAVKHRLSLAVAARQFAKQLGLDVGFQYRTVTFLDAPAVVYVVSAAPRTSLEPYTWSYPILGALPYRGSFHLDAAEALAHDLATQGYDVDVRPVTTYSLLGVAPDPILSTMIFHYDELDVVETVIHELAHATLFVPGQGAFNEGMATFIGKEGRRRFVAKFYGEDSQIMRRMHELDRDEDAYVRAIAALAFDLRVLFAQAGALTDAEILARKDRIFLEHQHHWQDEVAPTLLSFHLRHARLPDNNAELSAFGIYSLKQRVYEEAYASCREDMGCFLSVLRTVAKEPDPELALAERVRGRRSEVVLP